MTVIDHRPRPARTRSHTGLDRRPRRPASARPANGAPVYRGTGVAMSRAPHRRRPVSVTMTVTLAAVAALITIWLVSLAQSRAVGSADVPEQLAVVQVQPGENLQRLAARVAPDAPTARVAQRIRELNQLDSAALDAGQTLIAPAG